MEQDFRPYLAGLSVSIIWGFSFLLTKGALDILTPFHLLGLRFAMALLVFMVLRISGLMKVNWKGKNLKRLLLLTAVQPVSYFLFETIGINLTSSSETGMMIAIVPVVTTVLGIIFLNERPSSLQAGFMILSVTGVAFSTFMKGNIQFGGNLLGTFMVLGAVLSAGVFNILSRKFSSEFTPIEITYVMMWTGAIVFNTISMTQHLQQGSMSTYLQPLTNPKVIVAVFYLGILASVLAFFMNNFMLSRLEATRASVFSNLTTVCSIIAGVIIGNEQFYWFSAVGAGMILLGVWGTNYYSKPTTSEDVSAVPGCE